MHFKNSVVLKGLSPLALTFAIGGIACAQISNGGFEQGGGSFASWSTYGDTFIADSSLGSGPTEGLYDGLLSTATDGSGGYVPAGNGLSTASLESALNLTAGTLSSVGNGDGVIGSAISQLITVNAGDVVKFQWDFMTNQAYDDGTPDSIPPSVNNDDFAFASLAPVGPTSGSVFKLADIFDSTTITPNVSNPFIAETGFHTFTWVAPSSGQYLLGIGVLHTTGVGVQEDGVNSGLLVDAASAVPEPATCVALAAGALGLLRRRRGRRA